MNGAELGGAIAAAFLIYGICLLVQLGWRRLHGHRRVRYVEEPRSKNEKWR